MFAKKYLWLGLVAVGLFTYAACSDGSSTKKETNCTDGVDNDGDGRMDCADSDCASNAACQHQTETNCTDGVDNDSDGSTDCADADCAADAACSSNKETNCADGIDNDSDGSTDCADADCAADTACSNNKETNCTDGIDNDNDGSTDCADADCASNAACSNKETNCTDGVDNDSDGSTDCADVDCAADAACTQQNGDLSCMGAGSQDGQNTFNAIISCLQSQCSTECGGSDNNACNSCLDEKCKSQLDACDWAPAGNGGCSALNTCLNGCPNMAAAGSGTAQTCPSDAGLVCVQGCFSNSSQAGNDAFFAILDCVQTNCQDPCIDNYNQQNCQDCETQHCSTEIGNCQ